MQLMWDDRHVEVDGKRWPAKIIAFPLPDDLVHFDARLFHENGWITAIAWESNGDNDYPSYVIMASWNDRLDHATAIPAWVGWSAKVTDSAWMPVSLLVNILDDVSKLPSDLSPTRETKVPSMPATEAAGWPISYVPYDHLPRLTLDD